MMEIPAAVLEPNAASTGCMVNGYYPRARLAPGAGGVCQGPEHPELRCLRLYEYVFAPLVAVKVQHSMMLATEQHGLLAAFGLILFNNILFSAPSYPVCT